MSVEVSCPKCSAVLGISEENLDRRSRCPSCSHVFVANAVARETDSEEASNDQSGAGASEANSVRFSGSGDSGPDPLVDSGLAIAADRLENLSGDSNAPNPYAPASTQFFEEVGGGEISPKLVTVDEVISKSWGVFKANWAVACVVVVILSGVNYGATFVQNLLVSFSGFLSIDPTYVFVLHLALYAIFWVLGLWMQLGQSIVMLDIARGRSVEFSRMFSAGPYLFAAIGTVLILSVAVASLGLVLIGIPTAIAFAATREMTIEGTGIGGLIGLVLFVIPMIIVTLGLSMSQLFVVDQRLGAWDSIGMSWRYTSGNKLTLFLIGIVISGVFLVAAIVGLLLFCFGIIPAMIAAGGFASIVYVVFYLCMTNQPVVISDGNEVPT